MALILCNPFIPKIKSKFPVSSNTKNFKSREKMITMTYDVIFEAPWIVVTVIEVDNGICFVCVAA